MIEVIVSMGVIGGIGAILAVVLELADRYIANYGECAIDINDGTRTLTVEGGGNLLGALVAEGIFIPSACGGRGSCGYCKVKIAAGGGPVLPTETSWLTPQEQKSNMRLSCQVKIREDLKIHIPPELFLIKEYRGRVTRITTLTHDIKEVRIKLIEPAAIEFQTGQYLQLTVPEYGDVEESVYRAYSLSSPSFEKDEVEFIIRYVPEGICTTWVHRFLKEGDEVTVNGPHGDFFLRDSDKPVIMIAGGSGLAPFKGMLRDLAAQHSTRQVTFFFGAVSQRDLYHRELMAELEKELPNFKFVPALSKPAEEDRWQGETGLITDVVGRLGENIPGSQAYLCGSPGMIDACIAVLTKNGMPSSEIFYDKFS